MCGVWGVERQLSACREVEGENVARERYAYVKGGASPVDAVGWALWDFGKMLAGVVFVSLGNLSKSFVTLTYRWDDLRTRRLAVLSSLA